MDGRCGTKPLTKSESARYRRVECAPHPRNRRVNANHATKSGGWGRLHSAAALSDASNAAASAQVRECAEHRPLPQREQTVADSGAGRSFWPSRPLDRRPGEVVAVAVDGNPRVIAEEARRPAHTEATTAGSPTRLGEYTATMDAMTRSGAQRKTPARPTMLVIVRERRRSAVAQSAHCPCRCMAHNQVPQLGHRFSAAVGQTAQI